MYALTRVQDIFLKHQDSFEGVPANPTDLVFNDMYETAGYSNFTFTVPAISTDDDLLLTDNLYYVVYVDGEEMTFEADEYAIPETVTEVPWTLNEFHIFAYNGSSRLIDIFITGIESIGVQSIYYYDGVETRSDIVSINLESGVDKVGLDKEIAKVVYFDLAGREVVNPANGLYIQHTTYTDGTTVSTKKFVR